MNPLLLIALLGGAVTASGVAVAVTKKPSRLKGSLTSSASSAAQPAPTSTPTPPTSKYRQTFTPGVTVTLNVGDTIEIDPPTPPPAGNRWVFTSADSSLFATYACAVTIVPPPSNCVGFTAANDIGYFQALTPGTTTLSLNTVSGVMTIQINGTATSTPAPAMPAAPVLPAITSTYQQSFTPGTTIALKVGDTIEIDAPYAPTGGNRWNFESSNAAIFATYACATAMNATSGDFPVSNLTQAQCTGYALTNDIGYYQAVSPGTATLSLGYGNGTPVFSGVMTVQVSPA